MAILEARLQPAPNLPADQPPALPRPIPYARSGAALLVLGANITTAANLNFPMIVPALGLFLLIGLPVALLVSKVDWRTDSLAERIGYSLVTSLLLLMFAGLAVNTVLPPLGVAGALTRIPVLITGDLILAGLVIWRRDRPGWHTARPALSIRCTLKEKIVTRMSVMSVVLAVIGATRLNNGTGDAVSVVMMAFVVITLALLLLWRNDLDPGVISFVIYALSLALLLATSIRGFYTTGHDIQREYRVFELTKTNGNWNIGRFVDAYDACLSITILPTMLWEVTKVHDPYVFKVFFQAMFALCPVLVYKLSLRFTNRTLALIGISYLLCFPTFSNDMPFENRQEVAFLFIIAILLVMTNAAMALSTRRLWIAAFSVGMIVSHYSSASVFIATAILTWLLGLVLRRARGVVERSGRKLRLPHAQIGDYLARPVLGFANIALMLAATFVWIGPLTDTSSTLTSTIDGAFSSIGQTFSFNAKSSDVAYNIFSISQPSSTQLINEYRQQTISQTAADRSAYYPVHVLANKAQTPTVDINAPLSRLGTDLTNTGIPVAGIDNALHAIAAKLLQVLVLIGLLALLLRRRGRARSPGAMRMTRETYLFAVGTVIVLVAEVIVPVVSENYSILRAFMQGLLILSPLVALGSMVVFRPLGKRRATAAALVLALVMFVLLAGLGPQLVGGGDLPLSLNNGGLYYNIYYPHTQEIVGIDWLQRRVSSSTAANVQTEVQTDEYEVQRLKIYSGINPGNDIYPTLLRRKAYVFLGFTTVTEGLATVSYKGNLVTYQYPTSYLRTVKNLVFDDGGAEIFR